MNRQHILFRTGLVGLACLASTSSAVAGTASNALQVSATVLDGCKITATPMNFGALTDAARAPTATATVSLLCSPSVDYDVAMDSGLHSRGRNRQMRNGATGNLLQYRIYSDAARRRQWDDRRNTTVAGNTGQTGQVVLTAYGQIPSLAGISSAGSYHDTVVVTVNF